MPTINEQGGNTPFHGFNDLEIVSLYKFLCAYEKIEMIKKDKDFNGQYQELSNKLHAILKKVDLKVGSCIPIISDQNKVRLTDANNRSKIPAFLYHLRNSIAYGYIRKNTQIEIKDLWHSSFTASGNIDTDIFEDIVKCMNSHLL